MPDTSLCIWLLRDRSVGLRGRFNTEAEALRLSTVVLAELLCGAAKSARPVEGRRAVENFAGRLAVLPLDAEAAAHSADIRAELERAGQGIGAYDLLIAGHARSCGLVVMTGNLGEFRRV